MGTHEEARAWEPHPADNRVNSFFTVGRVNAIPDRLRRVGPVPPTLAQSSPDVPVDVGTRPQGIAMADRPDVSVVVPTRSRPGLVPRAVRSALAQTHDNLEVVVVVDGPDPATRAALDGIADARVRVVELSESRGA